MNIKSRPLLIAAGIALVVHILLSAIGTASSVLIMPRLMFDNASPNSAPSPAAMSGIMALSLGLCCVALLIDAGAGALYAYLHNKQEAIVLQDGLVGGAATGALSRVISSVVSVLLTLLMTPFLMSQMANQMGVTGAPADPLGAIVGAGMVGGLVGGVFNTCVAMISGSMLGAAGGGVFASLSERRQNA